MLCRKINLKEQKSDFSYWQTQSYQARLKALEEIRHSYHQWKYKNTESRLQRVYTISQR
ncbi:MAG: toxin secretion, membrane fusion protein [Oscillatoriales cyanobacterium]|nr:MAG: toxin secretion, membrane fusion protein [Oscillatoriales cyanobacterium]TAE22476.1 MAG: toxin secretion, membrane fusion protein [Oscillatoriales cyanobacterium]TAE41935.1 MAG: toxin secretion, membrane fusion protein [Oscillatoriales cyanobacterium]TAE51799.1 MAG: toxin secretion, membrane fusion protein [Oscillatoriales cyanobacterium]TAE70041.1 MAG: toxin secretion, membrane fusion protein [Oscillatoriales cyanobacterium]